MLCHSRFVKFKTTRYHGKCDEIHLESGETLSLSTLPRRPVATYFAHNSVGQFMYGNQVVASSF